MREYEIKRIDRKEALIFLDRFHYLHKEGFKFRSGINYGLFLNSKIIGVAVYNGLSVPETAKGCFGLERNQQEGIFELGRLALDNNLYERNLTSWFLSKTIKKLRRENNVRAILSYADSDKHTGFIYQATNFKYYGLTAPKSDFWILQADGTYKKHQRGKIRGLQGEYRPRSRKHRYLLIFDKYLKTKWKEEKYPKKDNNAIYNNTYIKENIIV